MERVTGIGGMFFRAKDPNALARWYAEHLGIDNQLEGGDMLWWQERGPTVFAPFPADTDYFGRPEQAWLLNFRVRDLDAMLAQLRAAGVSIDGQETEEGAGRFAWLTDPEGGVRTARLAGCRVDIGGSQGADRAGQGPCSCNATAWTIGRLPGWVGRPRRPRAS
jgi:glyoxylase I family protein